MQIQKVSELSDREFANIAHTELFLAMLARKYTISGPTNNVDSFLRSFKLILKDIFHISYVSNYKEQRTVLLYLSSNKDVVRLEKANPDISSRPKPAV